MNPNDMQTALEILGKLKESLLETLVDEVIRHKEDDPTSFSLQEIEDRFAIRLANLNTLIATLQDQISLTEANNSRIVVDIEEITRHKLESRLNEILEFISPEEFVNLSIIPTTAGKFLIAVAHTQQQ